MRCAAGRAGNPALGRANGRGAGRGRGEWERVAAAIAMAQKTVEVFLQRTFKPGMDAKTLLALYHTQAEHPMIFRDDDSTFNVPGFNHIRYAMTRVRELCGD